MACCEPELDKQAPVAYRNALIAVLAINLVMFGVEAAVGLFSGSRALRADALDFLGDAATYGLTLWALGQSLTWRFRAARIKGFSLLLLAVSYAYFAFSWRRGGQTLGMKCWRIRVVDEHAGGPLTWRQTRVRFAVALLSWAPLGLGYWWALTGARRTWHDRASHSTLVRV